MDNPTWITAVRATLGLPLFPDLPQIQQLHRETSPPGNPLSCKCHHRTNILKPNSSYHFIACNLSNFRNACHLKLKNLWRSMFKAAQYNVSRHEPIMDDNSRMDLLVFDYKNKGDTNGYTAAFDITVADAYCPTHIDDATKGGLMTKVEQKKHQRYGKSCTKREYHCGVLNGYHRSLEF